MCVCSINIKGGQVYHVPPWCCLVRLCGIPGACMHPLGWLLCRRRPLSLFGFSAVGARFLGGVGGWLVGVC